MLHDLFEGVNNKYQTAEAIVVSSLQFETFLWANWICELYNTTLKYNSLQNWIYQTIILGVFCAL